MIEERNKSNFHKFIGNIAYAFTSQIISLVLSVMMALIVPKVLGIREYAYWQLFIFYSSYVGFFHFGLNDGVYLRNGGKSYENLNSSLISSQFWISILFQTLIALFICLYGFLFVNESERTFILISTAAYLIIANATSYLGLTFQAVNQTQYFSISVIIEKVVHILGVLLFLLLKVKSFKVFVILHILGKVISLVYCMYIGREVVFKSIIKLKVILKELWININVGSNLMLSNVANQLILGIGRFTVDRAWGIDSFGKFAFSLSLTSFFLLFINQISMVLFPLLRRFNNARIQKLYIMMRDVLSYSLSGILLFYLPVKILLGSWLPQYEESLQYLALLLPLCIFDGKMQLLCNTYLKVLRMERILFRINFISFVISFLLSLFGAYVLESIYSVLIFMVVAVAIRCIIAEIFLARKLGISVLQSLVIECGLALFFILVTWFVGGVIGLLLYSVAYFSYLILSKEKIKMLVKDIKHIITK